MDNPAVSVVCEVFNHEAFLRKCLEGFAMQKTTFEFEVLVYDDASTDHSADIIREYEKKYPNLFKPIYQQENQYSKGVNIWTRIQFPRAKGKYIALCEGDDHWTDPLKLQKQWEYMEAHPDCSFCFHNAMIHYYDADLPDKPFAQLEDRDYTGQEACHQWITPTASYFFRRSIVPGYDEMMVSHPKITTEDIPLVVYCAKVGKLHALPEFMSVCGRHQHGWTQFKDAAKSYRQGRSWEDQRKAYGPEYHDVATSIMTGYYLAALARGFREKDFITAAKAFWRGIVLHPVSGFDAILRLPGERKRRNARMKKNA